MYMNHTSIEIWVKDSQNEILRKNNFKAKQLIRKLPETIQFGNVNVTQLRKTVSKN